MGVLGHEGGFSPDGKTFYVASLYGHTLAAVDLSNPKAPVLLWFTTPPTDGLTVRVSELKLLG